MSIKLDDAFKAHGPDLGTIYSLPKCLLLLALLHRLGSIW